MEVSVAPGSTHSGWWLVIASGGICSLSALLESDQLWYLFYEIQTLCIIHPVYGLPLDPLSV